MYRPPFRDGLIRTMTIETQDSLLQTCHVFGRVEMGLGREVGKDLGGLVRKRVMHNLDSLGWLYFYI